MPTGNRIPIDHGISSGRWCAVQAVVRKHAMRGVFWTVACVAVLFIAACGEDSGASSGFAPRNQVSIAGQEINVLLPYKIPERLLEQFTSQTGVKVSVNVTNWDAVHSKLIVANTAKTYVADVTEFDWSFTGQFAAARWYEPLEKVLDPALVEGSIPGGRGLQRGRPHLRGLLLERLSLVAVQHQDVYGGRLARLPEDVR